MFQLRLLLLLVVVCLCEVLLELRLYRSKVLAFRHFRFRMPNESTLTLQLLSNIIPSKELHLLKSLEPCGYHGLI